MSPLVNYSSYSVIWVLQHNNVRIQSFRIFEVCVWPFHFYCARGLKSKDSGVSLDEHYKRAFLRIVSHCRTLFMTVVLLAPRKAAATW